MKIVHTDKSLITAKSGKRQTRPLVRNSAPHQQTRNYLIEIKIWSEAPGGCLTPRETSRLTAGRNITLTLILIRDKSEFPDEKS
jgi:hypothetical protein